MLKHFLFLLIIFFPISLSQNPFSPKSLTTLTKYSDVTIKMDGIVYNLVLNVEDFAFFEDINFKIFIKNNNEIKVHSIHYKFITNDNFTFDTFNHLKNNVQLSVQYLSKNYYYYFKVEKDQSAKYLLLKLEFNSYDPSIKFTLSNTKKFEGGLSIFYFLLILVLFCLFISGICFGLFYAGYKIFKKLFPRLFYIPNQQFGYINNIYPNNNINYQINPSNGYIYPIIPMPNQQNAMPSYYVNYPQPQININQPQVYGMNMEHAPINIHSESTIGDNSEVVVNVPYEKPH